MTLIDCPNCKNYGNGEYTHQYMGKEQWRCGRCHSIFYFVEGMHEAQLVELFVPSPPENKCPECQKYRDALGIAIDLIQKLKNG